MKSLYNKLFLNTFIRGVFVKTPLIKTKFLFNKLFINYFKFSSMSLYISLLSGLGESFLIILPSAPIKT